MFTPENIPTGETDCVNPNLTFMHNPCTSDNSNTRFVSALHLLTHSMSKEIFTFIFLILLSFT